jgi:hypothetical protein
MILLAVLLMSLGLVGCGDDSAPQEREREQNFGAGLGESYKGMMDEARQTTDQLNEQMQQTEQRVRERDE